MSKEYRKKSRAKPPANGARQFMFVLIAFVCGYLSASFVNIASLSTWVKTQVLAQSTQSTVASSQKAAHNQLPKPKFEFYTLLESGNSAPPGDNPTTSTKSSTTAPDPVANASNVMSNTAVKTIAVVKNPALPPVSEPIATVEAPEKPALMAKENYLVQVASFSRREDAERMKASLILKGFNVNIAVANQQRVNWYRVIIGPYPSKVLAEKAQIALARSERVKGMIRKLDA